MFVLKIKKKKKQEMNLENNRSEEEEKQINYQEGKWSYKEHEDFLKILQNHPNAPWSFIAKELKTRTKRQVTSHYQKMKKRGERHEEKKIKIESNNTDINADNFFDFNFTPNITDTNFTPSIINTGNKRKRIITPGSTPSSTPSSNKKKKKYFIR